MRHLSTRRSAGECINYLNTVYFSLFSQCTPQCRVVEIQAREAGMGFQGGDRPLASFHPAKWWRALLASDNKPFQTWHAHCTSQKMWTPLAPNLVTVSSLQHPRSSAPERLGSRSLEFTVVSPVPRSDPGVHAVGPQQTFAERRNDC